MARTKKTARGRQNVKMNVKTPQKGKEENPIELDSNDDTRLLRCTPFDFNNEFENEETKNRVESFFQQKAPFQDMDVKDIYKHLLPSMKYYQNTYAKTNPLFLHGGIPNTGDGSGGMKMDTQVVEFLTTHFPNNAEDKKAIKRNVKDNFHLFITNGEYKLTQKQKPRMVTAVVFQFEDNHAFINWLAVHGALFIESEVQYYRHQQLGTFLLYFLFKGNTTCF